MVANLTSRYRRIFIGSDNQDWTLSAGAFSSGWDSVDEGGLIQASATLEILGTAINPESIDPRQNPARWRPGTPVRIEAVDDAGGFVQHPQGRLFILEEPEFPPPGGGITLQLGCRLTWHNTFEFDDEKTGVTFGVPTNTATVAQALLEANEIPGAIISLGAWSYGLAVPEGKGISSSFTQQAGDMAYSDNWRYLYQNPSGNIVAGQLDLSVGAPLVTITLGQNDVRYEGIKVESSPPDVVRCAGSGTVTTVQRQPIVQVDWVEGDRSAYEVGRISCPGSGIIGRTTTVIRWSNGIYTTTTTVEAPPSSVAVNPRETSGMGPCSVRKWQTTTEVKYFSLNKGGRLNSVIETVRQDRYTYFAGRAGATRRILNSTVHDIVKRTTTTYSYGADEILRSITKQEEQAQFLIDGSLESGISRSRSPDTSMRVVRREIERWQKISDTTWRKSNITSLPKKTKSTSPETGGGASVTNSSTSTSSAGDNQPPRPEIWEDGVTNEDVEFQGTATYVLPGGGSGRTRKRLEAVPYGFSQSQMEYLALTHVALIAGRHRAALVELPITTALLTAPPLFPFSVILADGSACHYRADAMSWGHSESEGRVAVTGILVGITAAPTQAAPSPSPVPLTSVAVVDSAVPVVDSSIPVFERV